MKVYVVTDGSYEEYHIVKVFSNKEAAEEYREWNNIHNLVEEFDLEHEMSLPSDLHKVYFMELCANVYSDGLSDIRYSVSKRLHTNIANGNYYHETPGKKNSDQFYIRVLRNIPAENFDEATEKSDIDVVVILDELSFSDIHTYNFLLQVLAVVLAVVLSCNLPKESFCHYESKSHSVNHP